MTRLRKVRSYLVLVYVMVLLGVFPLVMHNRYYDLTKTKFSFFAAVTFGVTACAFLLSLAVLIGEKNFFTETWNNFINKIKVPDILMAQFLIAVFLSWLFSEYREDALWGREGRYVGLVFTICCGLAYFIISRLYKHRNYVTYVLCFTACIVFLLGILHHFGLDPFNIQKGLDESSRVVFYSTIGNKNVLSSFIVLIMGISCGLYCYVKKSKAVIIYLITSVIGFLALFSCDSDSGFIGIGILFYILPFFYKRNESFWMRYTSLLLLFFIVGKAAGILLKCFPNPLQEENMIQSILCYNPLIYVLIIILLVILAVCYIRNKNYISFEKKGNKIFTRIWALLGIVSFSLIVGLVFWFSVIDKTSNIEQGASYLRFDKNWGTGRGEVWIKSVEGYKDFTVTEKLVGKGPDTAAMVFNPGMILNFRKIATDYFDNAHNEYLQYLITFGALGLLLYVGFLVSIIKKLLETNSNSVFTLACALSIICYGAQAVVNINQPITTPFIFIFAGMGLSAAYNHNI